MHCSLLFRLCLLHICLWEYNSFSLTIPVSYNYITSAQKRAAFDPCTELNEGNYCWNHPKTNHAPHRGPGVSCPDPELDEVDRSMIYAPQGDTIWEETQRFLTKQRVCVCMSIILPSARRPEESPIYYINSMPRAFMGFLAHS